MSRPVPLVRKIKNWVYIVQPGDTLASITTKLSGNPNRYYELVGANPHKLRIQAPPGFKYNFFKDLVEGEKLKVPGNWRSKEVTFGIGLVPDPNDIINQYGGLGAALGAWYNNGNPILPPGVTLPQGFPQGLTQDIINKAADVIIAWQPYTGLPDISNPNYIITTLLNVSSTDPNFYKVTDLFQQAVTFIKITNENNPVPPNVLNTIPWDLIPWNQLDDIASVFDNILPEGAFWDWLGQYNPNVIQYSGSQNINNQPLIINKSSHNIVGVKGIGDAPIWDPGDINKIPPDILNNIPWTKLGAIDWAGINAAIIKYGVIPTLNDLAAFKATQACWDKCIADVTKFTVDDFFADVYINTDHGCCRANCASDSTCVATPPVKCQIGQHVDSNGNCVTCPTNTVWNASTNKCEAQESPPLPSSECDSNHPCASGYDCDTKQGKCIATPKPSEPPKDNTILYVVGGLVGLLIVGGTIIAVSSKPSKSEAVPQKVMS